MKNFLSILLATVLVAAVAVPTASARDWGERHEFHRGGGCVACGFIGGLALGGILGGALAAPYYAAPPAPVYLTPPSCYTRPGYWSQVPAYGYGGYTTYQNVWVPQQTVCG